MSDPWYDYIASGKKTVEGRLCKGAFASFKSGDKLKIHGKNGAYICARVLAITKYDSFEEYLSQEGLRRTLPGIKTIRDGVAVYRQFYSQDKEKEFGVLAISIKKTKCYHAS